jgi:hypothetical protein
MPAAGTKAGAEKAKATRAAKKHSQVQKILVVPGVQVPALVPGVGTQQTAGPADVAGLDVLRSRRDKAAARERLSKLPDHGRNVAPQGLNRLPKSFAVGSNLGGDHSLASGHHPVEPRSVIRPSGDQAPRQGGAGLPGRTVQGAEATLSAAKDGEEGGQPGGPVLSGGVTLSVLAFLELAQQAGLDLPAVAAMARSAGVGALGVMQPIRVPAEGASIAHRPRL